MRGLILQTYHAAPGRLLILVLGGRGPDHGALGRLRGEAAHEVREVDDDRRLQLHGGFDGRDETRPTAALEFDLLHLLLVLLEIERAVDFGTGLAALPGS